MPVTHPHGPMLSSYLSAHFCDVWEKKRGKVNFQMMPFSIIWSSGMG